DSLTGIGRYRRSVRRDAPRRLHEQQADVGGGGEVVVAQHEEVDAGGGGEGRRVAQGYAHRLRRFRSGRRHGVDRGDVVGGGVAGGAGERDGGDADEAPRGDAVVLDVEGERGPGRHLEGDI